MGSYWACIWFLLDPCWVSIRFRLDFHTEDSLHVGPNFSYEQIFITSLEREGAGEGPCNVALSLGILVQFIQRSKSEEKIANIREIHALT